MAFGDFLVQSHYEPKQNYRFIVQMGDPARIMWEAKTVNKPKLSFSVVELNNVDGTSVYYPPSPSWDPLTITFMAGGSDSMLRTADTDVSRGMIEILAACGYDKYGERQYKGSANDAFNQLVIRQLNSEGDLAEEWVLINPFFERIDFGELDYSSEDLSEVTITVRYDHATVRFANGPEIVDEPTTLIPII